MQIPPFGIYLAAPSAGLISILPMIALVGIFYVIVMLPQQKRQKQWQQMVANIKAGDRITTSGGLRGTVISVKDDTVQIRVAPDNLRLEIVRALVVSVGDSTAS